MNAFVVLNPVAGTSDPDQIRGALERSLGERGHRYELYETTGQENLVDVVRQALNRGLDLVVAVGGDGTVSSVADALVAGEVPLGIVPAGTGNGLARDLGIPLDAEGALELLANEHRIQCIDALQVGERVYVLNVGVGISAEIMRETESDSKRRFGRMAYLWNVVREMIGLGQHWFTLMLDGRSERVKASEILVLNSGSLGSPLVHWGTDIRPDDGQVRVYAVRPRTARDHLVILGRLLLRREQGGPAVQCFDVERSLRIDVYPPLAVQGDGEVIGETPVEVKVVPGALNVIAPANPSPE